MTEPWSTSTLRGWEMMKNKERRQQKGNQPESRKFKASQKSRRKWYQKEGVINCVIGYR